MQQPRPARHAEQAPRTQQSQVIECCVCKLGLARRGCLSGRNCWHSSGSLSWLRRCACTSGVGFSSGSAPCKLVRPRARRPPWVWQRLAHQTAQHQSRPIPPPQSCRKGACISKHAPQPILTSFTHSLWSFMLLTWCSLSRVLARLTSAILNRPAPRS